MNQSDPSKYRKQFNRMVDQAIKECSRETGVTDLETVYRHLKKSASSVFKRLRALLADEQMRIVIQKRFKRCTVSVAEAAERLSNSSAQTEFDFFEIDQFRGLPQRISFVENAGQPMQYVEYNRSLERHRDLSIRHLNTGIEADMMRLKVEMAANQFLEPLVRRHGDLPAEDLARLWLRDQQQTGASGGAV
jgi:hypothetical protein